MTETTSNYKIPRTFVFSADQYYQEYINVLVERKRINLIRFH
jgi:hypothetical protein